MSAWQPIETAPKDGKARIKLRSESYSPDYAFFWNAKIGVWETRIPGHMGWLRGYWADDAGQPTEWQPAEAPQ